MLLISQWYPYSNRMKLNIVESYNCVFWYGLMCSIIIHLCMCPSYMLTVVFDFVWTSRGEHWSYVYLIYLHCILHAYFDSAVVPICLLLMLLCVVGMLLWYCLGKIYMSDYQCCHSVLCKLDSWCIHEYGTYELLISIL